MAYAPSSSSASATTLARIASINLALAATAAAFGVAPSTTTTTTSTAINVRGQPRPFSSSGSSTITTPRRRHRSQLATVAAASSFSTLSPINGEALATAPDAAAAAPAAVDDDGAKKSSSYAYATVFDFASSGGVESFERIDDAIMGGISTSSLRDVPGTSYASWSGVCRTDGGGFCGTRTLPFKTPLHPPPDAVNDGGLFVDCRLASDNEPDRRIWKMTVRTDTSRGELVYQAPFTLPHVEATTAANGVQADEEDKRWARVHIPLDSFKLVRGPRMVPDGPPLNVTGGIYQIGMTLSKFVMGVNTTELDNFRPGYFDLHLRRIGFYSASSPSGVSSSTTTQQLATGGETTAAAANETTAPLTPQTLTKEEALRKRPLILKLLLPIGKLLFSEQANRRRSAMKILREKRGLTRRQAMMLGMKNRANTYGLVPSLFKTASIVAVDALRTVLRATLRVCLFYPLVAVGRTVRFVKKNVFRMKVRDLPPME